MPQLNKIAISGKGGVGKTTLAALMAHIYAERSGEGSSKCRVIAIDADAAGGLAEALGLPREMVDQITPISEMDELIYERTGAKPGSVGGYFKLNPRVDDIPDRFSIAHQSICFLKLGTVEAGGSGCICPESSLLRALVTHLLLYNEDMLILDMEAGVEHLGRATAQAVDAFIVVVEPGRRSLRTAANVKKLAGDIGIQRVYAVANKVHDERQWAFIQENSTVPLLGYLSTNPELTEADMQGVGVFSAAPHAVDEARQIVAALEAL